MSFGSVSGAATPARERQRDTAEGIIDTVRTLRDRIADETFRVAQVANHLVGEPPPTVEPGPKAALEVIPMDVQSALAELDQAISRLNSTVNRLY